MTLIALVHMAFSLYTMMIIVQILGSWFPELQQFAVIQWIGRMTEPYLAIFRRCIPPIGVLDISPIAAFFVLRLLEQGVMGMLLS